MEERIKINTNQTIFKHNEILKNGTNAGTKSFKERKKIEAIKKNHVTQLINTKDILNENNNEWLLELYYSLQKSALKALRLSESKHTSINHIKQPSESTKTQISGTRKENITFKHKHRRSSEAINISSGHNNISEPDMPGKNNNEDLPPTPPPRMNAMTAAPPPLPPLPLHLLRETAVSRIPVSHYSVSPSHPTKLNYEETNLNQLLNQQYQTGNSLEFPYICLQHDYRNSPSSGFYSCSASAGSSSPTFNTSVEKPDVCSIFNAPQASAQPMILHSVKSTQVEKPQLQTAVAPADYLPPPPYRNYMQQSQCPATAVPITEPPSYASTMQSFFCSTALANNSQNTVTFSRDTPFPNSCSSVDSSNKYKKPPLPLPNSCEVYTPPPLWQFDVDKTQSEIAYPSETIKPNQKRGKVDHQSPIPKRKTYMEQENDRKDCKVRNYSPQAFKFYMEQHIENVLKSYKQRMYRRIQLEKEMVKIGLSLEAQCQMRKMLCQKESNYLRLKRAKMCKSMFAKIKLIGVGAFGEVTLVRKIDTNQLYAMKTLRKADVLKKNQVAHVKAERDILAEADNEWVVKLYFSFQDIDNLYFVMEYIPGGDLMSLLIKMGIFEEELARFYLAELTCAVESVHKIKFIHRDIKPDNILIDRYGHIKLTDFGLCTGFRWTHNSKYYENEHNRQDSLDFDENFNDVNCRCFKLKPLERRRRREHQRCLAHSLVGTPNYIAPEVLLRTGYTQLCDWWSVGVVLYEMLVGSPPFSADTPNETQRKIIKWQNTLKVPTNANLSPEATDLITKLCTSAEKRLGKNADEVKEHPFFAGIDFTEDIRKLVPPYIPKINFSTDTSNFDEIFPASTDSGASSESSSSSDVSDSNRSFHGFFEFTFRRFFDDVGGGVPFYTKVNHEEQDNHGAIYV